MAEALDGMSPLGSVLNGLPCEALVRVAEALRFWNSLTGKVSRDQLSMATAVSLLIRKPVLQQDGVLMRVAFNVRNTEYRVALATKNQKGTVWRMSDAPFTLPIHFVFGKGDVFMINVDPEV